MTQQIHLNIVMSHRDLARNLNLPVFLKSSARPKSSKMAKMVLDGVKWSKMVVFLPVSDDNCLSKKTGGRVTSQVSDVTLALLPPKIC